MKRNSLLIVLFIFVLGSCTKEGGGLITDDSVSHTEGKAGLITAGEWNDLDNWGFWLRLQEQNEISELADYWKFYTNNRISVVVKNGTEFLANAEVLLNKNNNNVWTARTDNKGRAELWIGLNNMKTNEVLATYQLVVNGKTIDIPVEKFINTPLEIQTEINGVDDKIELAFVVDATGSMGDEIDFLKEDLREVLQRTKSFRPTANLYSGTVFYRDKCDKYIVRKSGFTENINSTIDFIKKQKAAGGGDFPEAVHTALHTAVNELQWSKNARTKIAFLLLDAPPHHESDVIESIQQNVKRAAQKGIKLIPITASGINIQTEFLMRYLAMATNGTYVFITDDSGIGNDHLEATVGSYEVEYLNDLMVRLITKYAK